MNVEDVLDAVASSGLGVLLGIAIGALCIIVIRQLWRRK